MNKLFKSLKFNPHLLILVLIPTVLLNTVYAKAKKNDDKDYYQIEVIIFKNNNSAEINNENWPLSELNIPDNVIKLENIDKNKDNEGLKNIADLANYEFDFEKEKKELYSDNNIKTERESNSKKDNNLDSADNNYYKTLDTNNLQYTKIAQNIKRNSRYKIISHIGWRLPKKNTIKSKPIYFETGPNHKLANLEKINIESADNLELIIPEISGVIKLQQKKFVHADLQLLLSLPAVITENSNKPFELIKNLNNLNKQISSNQDSDDQDYNNQTNNKYIQSFKISENRRLKSKELNYFDHPAFGAIVVIS